jgi:hypothetical protein
MNYLVQFGDATPAPTWHDAADVLLELAPLPWQQNSSKGVSGRFVQNYAPSQKPSEVRGVAAAPEPASLTLLGSALFCLGWWHHRRV